MREVKGYLSKSRKGKKLMVQIVYYENGELHKKTKTLDETNRQKAQRVADKMIREKEAELQEKEKEKKKKYHNFLYCLDGWLKAKSEEIEEDTADAYAYRVKYIKNFFTVNKPLATIEELTVQDINAFYQYLLTEGKSSSTDNNPKGLSVRTIRDIAGILNRFFDEAVAYHVVTENVAKRATIPRQKENNVKADGELHFMEFEEAKGFLQFLKEQPKAEECEYLTPRFYILYPLVVVCLTYGFRRSEVLALRWDSVREDEIEVCRTVVRTNRVYYKDNVKTRASHRSYPLTDDVRCLLEELKQEQLRLGIYNDNGFVFVDEYGRGLDPDYVTKLFKKAVKKCECTQDNLTFHDLRKTCASLLFEKEWTIDQVAGWIGHSDLETTRRIYLKITEKWKKDRAEELDGMFGV